MLFKNKYFIGLALLTATGAVGCKKFLEKTPDSTIGSASTPTDISQLLTSAYAKATYVNFCESMSDNVDDGKFVSNSDRTNEQSYLFQEVQGSATMEDCPEMYWVESYKAIAVANQALKVISNHPGDSTYNAQKGEALVARAYAHFMLVCLFSKFYDPATAANNPGIPYVTEPEDIVLKKYERKTVAYVYEMVEKDLLAGIPLIKDANYSVPGFHFNKIAANAFAARFYLFKKDYANALKFSNDAIPPAAMTARVRPWNTIYYLYTPAQLFVAYTNISDPANLLLCEQHSLFARYVGDYRYGKTNAKTYSDIDTLKRIAATTATLPFPSYYYGNDSYFCPKFNEYFVVTSTAANIGDPYIMMPLFSAEEVLFTRAEAQTHLGNSAEALNELNLYLSKRLRNYNATTMVVTQAKINARYGTAQTDKENLLKAVLNTRRLEFVQEGLRYFDMQRYNMPVMHVHQPDLKVRAYDTLRIAASDNRRVLQIPQTAVLAGIELNPR